VVPSKTQNKTVWLCWLCGRAAPRSPKPPGERPPKPERPAVAGERMGPRSGPGKGMTTMQKDMTRRLVELGVRSALTQCGGSPGRAVRNLVDLGLTFSRGQLQRQLLTTIQTLLGNPDSAYYPLIRDVVANTDTDRLVRFGVNVGYESCSKGARRLRTVE